MGDGDWSAKSDSSGSPSIDNAESLAVALRSDGAVQGTKVVAKGHGATAEQILDIAFSQGVKVRTDAELVQMLDLVELDSDIPLEALAAVAEILSYLYRMNAAAGGDNSEQE